LRFSWILTNSTRRKQLSDLVWASALNTLPGAAQYLTLVLLATRFGHEDAGLFAIAGAVVMPAVLMANLGLRSAISVGIATLEQNLIQLRVQSFLVSLLFVAVMGLLWSRLPLDVSIALLFLRSAEGFTDIRVGVSLLSGRLAEASILVSARSLVAPTLVLTLPNSWVLASVLATVAVVQVSLVLLFDARPIFAARDYSRASGPAIQPMIRQLASLGLNGALAMGTIALPRILIAIWSTPAEVARFSLWATPFLFVGALFAGVLEVSMAPRLAKSASDSASRARLELRSRAFGKVLAAASLALAAATAVWPGNPGGARLVVVLLLLGLAPSFGLGVTSALLLARGSISVLPVSRALSAGTILIVGTATVPAYPVAGAAAALALGAGVALITQTIVLARLDE